MASFFATLKRELIYFRTYRTRDEARKDIFEFVEVFYNQQRLHSALQYCSPVAYEGIKNALSCIHLLGTRSLHVIQVWVIQ